jgi:hypothetical protein
MISGRILQVAVFPNNPSHYMAAEAAGNIFMTDNNGTTFTPVFENYGSFSIGSITIDPKNPNIVWVGTGENNSQRAAAYGDGVYRGWLGAAASWAGAGPAFGDDDVDTHGDT